MVSKLKDRTIRCLLFDLGNTLWTHVNQTSWDKEEQAATQRAIDFLSQYITPEQQLKVSTSFHGQQLRAAIQAKISELSRLHPGTEPNPCYAVQEALLDFGLPCLSHTICRDFFEALCIPIINSRLLFEDTCSTLAELQKRGFLLGVVTNRVWGGKPFLEGMRKLGLLAYFDPGHIAISADLGICKPNPAIFLHALNALNVKPEEAMMVGDSLYADIFGAKELNMLAVWKPKLHLRAELQALGKVDDDALLTYAFEAESKYHQLDHQLIRPDIIIEHVRDLLDIV